MEIKEHLAALAIREKSDTGNILPAYEVKRWPAGRLDELVERGDLIQIEDATSIKCPACSKGCPVDPVRGVTNDGTEYCEVLCELEGSPDIDTFYLKQWQITEKIRTQLPKTMPDDPPPPADYTVKQQGKQYMLTYKGNHEILPDTLGSKYIVYLLTHKDVDISAFQLELECKLKPEKRPDDPDDVSEGLKKSDHEGDLGNLSEFKPEQMQAAIEHLEQKIEDTDKRAEKDSYQSKIDQILKYMASSKNIHGKKRTTGDPLENARSRVTQAINRVKAQIKDKPLKAHLERIKTGPFISYKPDDEVFWEISH